MKLKVRVWTKDNMFFGEHAKYATVTNGAQVVKEFAPPFARAQAWFFVLKQFGRG